ncbi:MAG: nucleotide exchange factor GrpE [Actinocatenispora sp.]
MPLRAELVVIRAQLAALGHVPERLAQLQTSVAREQERAAFREEIIDRLHNENQQLRRSELEATLEPVRAGLYRLYDYARREADRWALAGRENPNASQQSDASLYSMFSGQVGALFAAFAEEAVEVLARTGVEPFEVAKGERYDMSLHRPVDTVPVDDPEWDGLVVETISSGFVRGEQIARRADVVVAQLTER